MFSMVVEKLFIADVQKISERQDKMICAIGITKILTEAPSMLDETYLPLWYLERCFT